MRKIKLESKFREEAINLILIPKYMEKVTGTIKIKIKIVTMMDKNWLLIDLLIKLSKVEM